VESAIRHGPPQHILAHHLGETMGEEENPHLIINGLYRSAPAHHTQELEAGGKRPTFDRGRRR
jgi:hypothetical protein